MFKKTVLFILIVCILMAGAPAFAANSPGGASASPKPADETHKMADKAAELKPYLDQIRANRQEMAQLRDQARVAYQNAKGKVQQLLENKENLTKEQVEMARQAINRIRNDGAKIRETVGGIARETPGFRAAIRGNDIEAAKNALNKIMAVQIERISNMKQTMEDLEDIGEL